MSKFINTNTKVVVSVDDSKDDRFVDGWDVVEETASTKSTRTAKK